MCLLVVASLVISQVWNTIRHDVFTGESQPDRSKNY